MNIVVLAGGLSPEREVSLSSGCLISNALMNKGHNILLVDLLFGYEDVASFDSACEKYNKSKYEYIVPEIEPDLQQLKESTGNRFIGSNVLDICKTADIVFLALHGSIGENGQIQAIFDTFNISYTGSGYSGSLLAMNKTVSKKIMSFHGINTPNWDIYNGSIPFLPCVIKPVNCGSSIGISIVETEKDFSNAISYATKYENEILIEEKIIGREFSVGILNGNALPVIEIIPDSGFYNYKNKYQAGLTREICPADISQNTANKLQQCALDVNKALNLDIYSRVDFILDCNGDIYCLEANTLPGMTPTSLLPQEAMAIGISYEDLCEQIVILSYKKRRNPNSCV